jgi:alkylhydroperoxidase family enzyme
LQGIAIMVTSQENACRYCYGVARAGLCSMGIEESVIEEIERDTKLAGADEKERALIGFCRNLARSSPRPAKDQREALESLGHDPRMLVELAYHVSMWSFVNRVATCLAVPLESDEPVDQQSVLTRMVRRWLGLLARRPSASADTDGDEEIEDEVSTQDDFSSLVAVLDGASVADSLATALRAGFGPTLLPRRTKSLMVAVLARALQCKVCETEARAIALEEGLPSNAIEEVLTKLSSTHLDESERKLIAWTRETAHFETGPMQQRTIELRQALGDDLVVEAIGVAALGNAMVRMGMLSS